MRVVSKNTSQAAKRSLGMTEDKPIQPTVFNDHDRSIIEKYFDENLKYIYNFPSGAAVMKNPGGYALMVGKESDKTRSDKRGRVRFAPHFAMTALLDLGSYAVEDWFKRNFDYGHQNKYAIVISPLTYKDLLIDQTDWKCEYSDRGKYTYISGSPPATPSIKNHREVLLEHPCTIFGFQQFEQRNPVEEIHIRINGTELTPIFIEDTIERNPLNLCWVPPFIITPKSTLVVDVFTRAGKSDLRPIGVKMMPLVDSLSPKPPVAL